MIPDRVNPLHSHGLTTETKTRVATPVANRRSVNPFMKWTTHELQEYLMTSHNAESSIVLHMHLKRDLAVASLKLCNEHHNGCVPPRPKMKSTSHAHSDTKYVKRSAHAYKQKRIEQKQRQKKFNRFQAGGYLQKHGSAKSLGHGAGSGLSLSSSLSPPPAPTRKQTHEIFHATGMKSEQDARGKAAKNQGPHSSSTYSKPSKLKAMAFAIEHSPRDWERFERENDEIEEIHQMKSILNGTSGRPIPTGYRKKDLEYKLRSQVRYVYPTMFLTVLFST